MIGQLAQQIDALKRQARQAVSYKQVSAEVRKAEATLFHLRWVAANAEVAEAEPREGREHPPRRRARPARRPRPRRAQANAAADLPPLRDEEAKAGAALQRLVMARETLDREEARVNERIAELDRRLVQLARRHRARAAPAGRRRGGAGTARRRRSRR